MRSRVRFQPLLQLAALLVVGMLVLSACGSSTPGAATPGAAATTASSATTAPKAGGVLRIGIDVDASTADPRLRVNTTEDRLRELVFDGLIYIKADYSAAPLLAESW